MSIAKAFKHEVEMYGIEVATARAISELESLIKQTNLCVRCGGTGVLRRAAFNDYVACDACNGKGH